MIDCQEEQMIHLTHNWLVYEKKNNFLIRIHLDVLFQLNMYEEGPQHRIYPKICYTEQMQI